MITSHHANTRGSRAAKFRIHIFVSLKQLSSTCHVSTISYTSPIFPTVCLTNTHKIYGPRPVFTLRCSTAEWRINTNPISHTLHEGTEVKMTVWPSRQVRAFEHGELIGRQVMTIIEHTTNPEFKCVPDEIKDPYHFDANRWTRWRTMQGCVSEVTTTSVQAHGSPNRARNSEAVQGSTAHEHGDRRTHPDA